MEGNGLLQRVIDASKGLEVFDLDIRSMHLNSNSPCENDLLDFISHMKRVNNSDLSFPIILHYTGVVMDGRHRMCKAILNGYKTIKAVRFSHENIPLYDRLIES